MSKHTDEGGVDLVNQQDSGFSLGSFSRRDGGSTLIEAKRAEADAVAGKIAAFAASKGLNYAAREPIRGEEAYGDSTTFLLGERKVHSGGRSEFELTVAISDTASYMTSDGPTTVSAVLSFGPSRSPFFSITEKHGKGTSSYGFEAKPSQLRAVLRSLENGAVDSRRGSSHDRSIPSWRSLAK